MKLVNTVPVTRLKVNRKNDFQQRKAPIKAKGNEVKTKGKYDN